MTAPNSKLLLDLLVPAFLIAGCGAASRPTSIHRCQAIVVVDKTNSVNYSDKLFTLRKKLRENFETTYAIAERDIQCSRLTITGNTRMIPELDYFTSVCPPSDDDSRSQQAALQQWRNNKRQWTTNEVNLVVALLDSPCHSNRTDILSIFSGIQQVQHLKGPWDSINVYIFSDMTNTISPINMMKDLTITNALEKGKTTCQQLISRGEIAANSAGNLYLTIYTPTNMDNTGMITQFWKGFFDQWGLPHDHWHFE